MLSIAEAVAVARDAVGGLRPRWEHVAGVGRCAERLAEGSELVPLDVVLAAWLHDVGYGPAVKATGFHPLDGARFLRDDVGLAREVVGLVAWHTGAAFEAEERGLAQELAEFDKPDALALDVLSMIDLSVSPTGEPIRDVERIAEILRRYEDGDPVFRAVTRSRPSLLAASARGKALLGLPDDWPVSVV